MADGGFDAQRNKENQEELAQKLVVCEVGAGLFLLEKGGTLLIKMFGFQTPLIRSVMQYLFSHFQRLAVVKPVTSRPASAERYVICLGYQGKTQDFGLESFCNTIFLDQATIEEKQVLGYLDEFDNRMLRLNLETCFAILSEMQCPTTHNSREVRDPDLDSFRSEWRL